VDLGCILLGDSSRLVDPGVGRSATVEEGLAHMERALESGLLPLIGHVWIDKLVFGVKDYSRLLTLCFCCRCCCVVRSEMRGLVSAYPRSLVPLEGIRVEVTEECVGCGECVPVCPIQNVSLDDGRARVGEMCLGCGTCARTCSRGNIEVVIEPGSAVQEELRRRIEAGVNIE
jgi:UDP-glucose 4-epimerase